MATGEDEMSVRELLLRYDMDAVVLVADAKNLRRSLALALELAELGVPMVFDLNMVDEAESMGLDLRDQELSEILGVPVARTIAAEDIGIHHLAELLSKARPANRLVQFPKGIEKGLKELEKLLAGQALGARGLGILLLAGDRRVEEWLSRRIDPKVLESVLAVLHDTHHAFGRPLGVVITDSLHARAQRIAEEVCSSEQRSPSLLLRFGSLAQRPLSGTIIALCVVALGYLWVGSFGATLVVDTLSTRLFDGLIIPACEKLVVHLPSLFLRDALMDRNFGLLPTGLFLAVGLVLPVLFCFYLFLALLEDSGYLPRLSVLFDRVFRWMGLNGRAVIPFAMGFSCITMAVITTRMLPTRKERFILTLLLILGVPCAPLLSTMLVVLAPMPWTATLAVFGIIASQILVAGFAANKLIPGEMPDLILEIPRMRIPRPRMLLSKTWQRTWQFMKEALPVFLLASFLVFLFDRVGGLRVLEEQAQPLVQGLLGLPDEAVQVFIKTAIRRETGVTELSMLRSRFDNLQLVVTMLVMTFLMPCINATFVIVKERGLRQSAVILGTVMVWALVVGTIVNHLCRALGVTF